MWYLSLLREVGENSASTHVEFEEIPIHRDRVAESSEMLRDYPLARVGGGHTAEL